MKEIPLTRGLVALVDDEDYERVAQFKWYAAVTKRKTYAARATGPRKARGFVLMHRFILGTPDGALTDHANLNGLDNRRENLRQCNYAQNGANSGHRGNKYGLRGVHWYAPTQNYTAQTDVAGIAVYLGRYPDPASAGRAYDGGATAIYGEFAKLNFPESPRDNPQFVKGITMALNSLSRRNNR